MQKFSSLVEVDECVVDPNMFPDFSACQDLLAAANQEFQNPERLRRKLDPVASPPEFTRAGIELECVEAKDRQGFTH